MTIQLARRLQRVRPSATVSITDKASRLQAEGRDIIRLSVGEPDFDTPEHIRQAAIDAIAAGDTKYTPLAGTPALRAAICRKLSTDNGLHYEAEQILVSNGAKQSCFNLCQTLLEPGDEVIVPAPFWVSYPDMVRLSGAEPVFVHAGLADRFLIQPEQLAAAITPATRMLILNSPSNPTGSAYTADELQALGEVLIEHPRIVVLADEIYERIYWGDSPLSSFAAACPSLAARTVTVNGMSKGYAMSGWRIGYAAGPAAVIRAMTVIQGQSTTSASSVGQAAALAALEGDQTTIDRMNAVFRERHARVLEGLERINGLKCAPGGGAFYLFPDIGEIIARKGLDDDVRFCEALLEAEGLALVPGSAFGTPGHVRISFAADTATLDAALERLARFAADS